MKRLLDVVAVLIGFMLIAPVILLLAVLVLVLLDRPVLFRQTRPGLNGQLFNMYKFRTMSDRRGKDGNLMPDEQRLGRFGRLLRSSSLDELPELFNVLRGEMSLVGPRPLLVEYLPLYTEQQARRHEVRPGITGWAQVNGRNAISWEEKFELDVWYVDNHSLALDLKILWMTVMKVTRRDDISHDSHVTMEKFTGTGGSRGK